MLNSPIIRNKQPYQSTNIYRVTASLIDDFPILTPFEKIQKARPIVFPFDYPTPENIEPDVFKDFFETMFISKYCECFFKFETFEAWQVKLYSKMLEIMPTYCKMLENFFYSDKVDLLLNQYKETVESHDDTTGNRQNDETGTGSATRENKNINSSFPSNLNRAGTNIGNVNYADAGAIDNGSDSSRTTRKATENHEENRNGTVKREGYNGNIFDQILKFDEHFNGIFTAMLNEFGALFTSILF